MVAIVKYRFRTIEDALSTIVDLFKEGLINYSMRVKDGWVELRAWKAIKAKAVKVPKVKKGGQA